MNVILKIILHLFFWTVFFFLSATISFGLSGGTEFIRQHVLLYLSGVPWAASAFYFFYFFLYRYIEKHRFVIYILLSIISVVGISVLFIAFYRIFVFNGKFNVETSWNYTTTAGTYVIASCGSLLRGFISWIESSGQKEELVKRNLQLELDSLRSQVNPHFLFNTLNNIDALILSQPRKASEMLITLSDVMRYMLYQTRDTTVTLGMEHMHLLNVVALHRIRFLQPDYIRYKSEIANPEKTIAPLLFLPFVENACKFAQFGNKLPAILISMQQAGEKLTFTCSNPYNTMAAFDNQNGGIGLENVKKRLQLLYPGRHQLDILFQDNEFLVTLAIELS
ncbi:MAG TPA: sensor histidine kinase [Paludibacter sp.]|nr:sensor histidine kinase [Paludibacter sp.]